ncbi:UNVERIFIED_CONTAM: hypothetical protein GTU68_014537, partial [Idotea baltica]|nr:hypothetical protein [Idotea baltica]
SLNYCSNCGSSQLLFTVPEGDNRQRYCCQNCEVIHYQNPKMVVGCLPYFEDKILLCKRAIEPRYGFWNLPAGYLENGETLEEGAVREAKEEAGIEVEIQHLHCIYNIPRISQTYFFFLAKMKTPEWTIGIETLEVKMCLPEEIPFEDMAFPSSNYAIRKYLKHQESENKMVHRGTWKG